jgi:excinuclease ABC subunit C
VIDGGDGQLGATRDALSVTGWDVPAVALAKEVGVCDEAHRFAVQYHQMLRDDVSTVLEAVPGVGDATAETILRRL